MITCLTGRIVAVLPSAVENRSLSGARSSNDRKLPFSRRRNPELLRHLIPYFSTNEEQISFARHHIHCSRHGLRQLDEKQHRNSNNAYVDLKIHFGPKCPKMCLGSAY